MQVRTDIVVVGSIEFQGTDELTLLSSELIKAYDHFDNMPKVVRDFLTATDTLHDQMRIQLQETFGSR